MEAHAAAQRNSNEGKGPPDAGGPLPWVTESWGREARYAPFCSCHRLDQLVAETGDDQGCPCAVLLPIEAGERTGEAGLRVPDQAVARPVRLPVQQAAPDAFEHLRQGALPFRPEPAREAQAPDRRQSGTRDRPFR